MPSNSFAAHLAVSTPVTGPLDFGSKVEEWLLGLAQGFIDTPEKQAAIIKELMDLYDAVGLAVGRKNALAGSIFPLMRGTVQAAISLAMKFVSPPSPPVTPDPPSPTGATQGSAP